MTQTARKYAQKAVADARHFQILSLACLITIGWSWFDFDIRPANAIAMMFAALATQYVITQILGLPHFDARSPLISSLSLCLLLRTNSIAVAVVAACIAIASKYIVRWRGKHIFNPTNFGIVVVIFATHGAWVSPGQWGSAIWSVFLMACLGGLVVNRAGRADVSLAVLVFYVGLLFGRALWLGDPVAIPLHQIQNGGLLIFAFFMISDPKTTPDSRLGRILFALLVVAFAGWIQFGLFHPNGLLYALTAIAPVTPLIDRLLPGRRFQWTQTSAFRAPIRKGSTHEQDTIRNTGPVALPDAVR